MKVKHTFIFETTNEWNPNLDYCWAECPFKMCIGLSNSCNYKKNKELECPFVKLGTIDIEDIDDESYEE